MFEFRKIPPVLGGANDFDLLFLSLILVDCCEMIEILVILSSGWLAAAAIAGFLAKIEVIVDDCYSLLDKVFMTLSAMAS